jgi:hypothetical protein
VGSNRGHYANLTIANWLGLGEEAETADPAAHGGAQVHATAMPAARPRRGRSRRRRRGRLTA